MFGGELEKLNSSPEAMSSGSSYSMNRGLQPRILENIFLMVLNESKSEAQKEFLIKSSFIEIYNESIIDLLNPSSHSLMLREDIQKGVYVEGVMEEVLVSLDDAIKVVQRGSRNRHIGATNMNISSSRSHSVFTLFIESKCILNGVKHVKNSKFHFVDLAGSERQKQTASSGERLKEAGNINKSLTVLGSVINGLVENSDGKKTHIRYRDSKLTFLLKDSLGGNSKTSMIANISPSSSSFSETLSTLKFAQRAKLIKNKALINEESSGNLDFLKKEIKRLNIELSKTREALISKENQPVVPQIPTMPQTSFAFGQSCQNQSKQSEKSRFDCFFERSIELENQVKSTLDQMRDLISSTSSSYQPSWVESNLQKCVQNELQLRTLINLYTEKLNLSTKTPENLDQIQKHSGENISLLTTHLKQEANNVNEMIWYQEVGSEAMEEESRGDTIGVFDKNEKIDWRYRFDSQDLLKDLKSEEGSCTTSATKELEALRGTLALSPYVSSVIRENYLLKERFVGETAKQIKEMENNLEELVQTRKKVSQELKKPNSSFREAQGSKEDAESIMELRGQLAKVSNEKMELSGQIQSQNDQLKRQKDFLDRERENYERRIQELKSLQKEMLLQGESGTSEASSRFKIVELSDALLVTKAKLDEALKETESLRTTERAIRDFYEKKLEELSKGDSNQSKSNQKLKGIRVSTEKRLMMSSGKKNEAKMMVESIGKEEFSFQSPMKCWKQSTESKNSEDIFTNEADFERLMEELSKEEMVSHKLRNQIKNMEAAHSITEGKLGMALLEVENLSQLLDASRAERVHIQEEMDTISSSLSFLQEEYSSVKRLLVESNHQRDKLSKEKSDLQAQLGRTLTVFEKQSAEEFLDLRDSLNKAENALKEKDNLIGRLKNAQENLKSELGFMQAAYNENEKKLEESRAKTAEMENGIMTKKMEISDLSESLRVSLEENNNLKRQMDDLSETFAHLTREKEESLWTKEKDHLAAQEAFHSEIFSLKEEVLQSKRAIQEYSNVQERLSIENDSLRKEMEEKEEMVRRQMLVMRGIREEVDKKVGILKNLRNMEELQAENLNLKSALEENKKQFTLMNEKAEKHFENQDKELQSIKKQYNLLEASLCTTLSTMEMKETELNQAKSDAAKAVLAKDHLMGELLGLKRKVEGLETEKETIRTKMEFLEKQNKELKKGNDEMSAEMFSSGPGNQRNEQRIKLLNKIKEENGKLKEEKEGLLNKIVRLEQQIERKNGMETQSTGKIKEEWDKGSKGMMQMELDVQYFTRLGVYHANLLDFLETEENN